jgi:prepilin-type N-terminal cleavage/methylation domain-containing protein
MKTTQLSNTGFTIIELMVCIVVIAAISVLALTNIRGARSESRDAQKKTDINAIFFQLEAFHEANGYYPKTIDEKVFKGIDPESLIDNNGNSINQAGSVYSYTSANCAEEKCRSYELQTQLEKEAPFVRLSLVR